MARVTRTSWVPWTKFSLRLLVELWRHGISPLKSFVWRYLLPSTPLRAVSYWPFLDAIHGQGRQPPRKAHHCQHALIHLPGEWYQGSLPWCDPSYWPGYLANNLYGLLCRLRQGLVRPNSVRFVVVTDFFSLFNRVKTR